MPYTDRFISTDNLITNLSPNIAIITNTAILASYAGFLSVSSITVYELAIKDIFSDFATKKHLVFGHFVEKYLSRINGRIQINDLKSGQVKAFGNKYLQKFDVSINNQSVQQINITSTGAGIYDLFAQQAQQSHRGLRGLLSRRASMLHRTRD